MVSLGQEESPLEVIQEGAGLALGWDRVGGRVGRGGEAEGCICSAKGAEGVWVLGRCATSFWIFPLSQCIRKL